MTAVVGVLARGFEGVSEAGCEGGWFREMMCWLCGSQPETTNDDVVGHLWSVSWRVVVLRGGGLLILWKGASVLRE